MASTFNARDAAVYERSMGRWSSRLAPGFLAFADVGACRRVLDVGCGTGSLLAALGTWPGPRMLQGIDASEVYVTAARERFPGAGIELGDACAMPFGDGAFDAALSQLVLQFVPEPAMAVAEMRRVVQPGGIVAAAVWNSGGGMPHQRMFWDTAAMLDPRAATLRDATFTRPMTRRHELTTLFTAAGLGNVQETALTIWMEFAGFMDFWEPIAGGEGTLGRYVSGLSDGAMATLQHHLSAAYCSGEPDGPRQFACTAMACRGITPTNESASWT